MRRVRHKLFHDFLTTLLLSWKCSVHRDLHKRSREPLHGIQLGQPYQQYPFKVTVKKNSALDLKQNVDNYMYVESMYNTYSKEDNMLFLIVFFNLGLRWFLQSNEYIGTHSNSNREFITINNVIKQCKVLGFGACSSRNKNCRELCNNSTIQIFSLFYH